MKFMFTMLVSLFIGSTSWATKVIGNGGDTYALEFTLIAKDIQNHLEIMASSREINLLSLNEAIKSTKVESTENKLFLNNIPKDAINYPTEKRIIFNRTAWVNSKESFKPSLVLHEYLGIMGINDSSYSLSISLLKSFGYGKRVTEVKGPFTVNFNQDLQYALKAYVTLENYGPESWPYNARQEQMRLIIESHLGRKVFLLPAHGRIISVYSRIDGEEDGVYISILQPVKSKSGHSRVHKEKNSEYILHVIRDYRIELRSSKKDAIPDDLEFVGPITNTAE